MCRFELREYQQNIIDNILASEHKRNCVSLATGGGKTVVFSELVNRMQGRILICVHREELVRQTSATLQKEHELLIPKTKKVNADIVIAMVQTLNNRIKKGEIDINSFDYIIVDEAHRGEFMKILNQFNNKVIGFTATPNYEKIRYFYKCLNCGSEYDTAEKCCKRQTKKYKQKVPLSEYYHNLIEGVDINFLIENEYLVKDEHFVLDIDTKKLVYDDRKQDYTEESISLVFGSDEAINNTIDNYLLYCQGLKTMIFNPNTLVNKKLFDKMIDRGINAKMYDSKNSEENRTELVEWFKNTKDAVLLNVHIFTTGFDVTDVECIFLNKKTKSINLYIQMIGRGGRITDNIFKPKFKVIDLGNNFEDFGKWSDYRNWSRYFFNKETKAIGAPTPASVRDCHKCESIISANSLICPECGAEKKYIGAVTGVAKSSEVKTMPEPQKIIDYCIKNDLECLDARKIVYNYVAELFENTSYETFSKAKYTGELFERTKKFIRPYYFAIQKSELKGNKVKRYISFVNEVIKKIDKYYDRRSNTSADI